MVALSTDRRILSATRIASTQLHLGQHHQKFLAAVTDHDFRRGAELGDKDRSHSLQAEIASAMAIFIIEPLEVVDIHHDYRHCRWLFVIYRPQPAQLYIQMMAVRQTGEGIAL
jgi:hypothetical protein